MISKLKFSTGAALLALTSPILATPAFAQEATEAEGAVVATAEAPVDEAALVSKRDQEMFDMIGKIFEIKDTTPIEPKRLAAANKAMKALVPDGMLAKMMNEMATRFIAPISDLQPDMSVYDIMSSTNVYEDSMQELDEAKRKEITALLDPNRKDRIKQMADAVMPFVNKTMTKLEMPMREGMARAYARKFTVSQLNEMNAFFATPTGALYAAESYPLQADPEVMHAMVKAMPKMIEDLKTDGPEIEAVVKKLPDAKNVGDLNDSELAKLASLTGISLDVLKENRNAWGASEEAATAAVDAAAAAAGPEEVNPYADETGEEPWYDDTNWSKAERTKVAKLSKTHDTANEKATAAYGKWETAYNAAIAASRDKFKAEGWKPEAVAAEVATEAAAAPAE